jgi:hypothetical protein
VPILKPCLPWVVLWSTASGPLWTKEPPPGPPPLESPKPSVTELLRTAQPGDSSRARAATSKSLSPKGITDGYAELLGLGFTVPAQTCRFFDSEMDFGGTRQVAISLLAVGASLATTRVIPFFSVPGAPYAAFTTQLRGSDFVFSDGGGGVVPVSGRLLRLMVCNDGTAPLTYTQLSVYSPGVAALQ